MTLIILDTCPAIENENLSDLRKGSNGTCVFPFSFKGSTHYECQDPAAFGEVGFCSFDSEYREDRWGYCTETCKKGRLI